MRQAGHAGFGLRCQVGRSRSVSLTDAGQGHVAARRCIMDDRAGAERAAAREYGQARVDPVVTAQVVFGRWHLVPVIAAFRPGHPAIDISLTLSDRVLHLVDDSVDVGPRIAALPDGSMVALRPGRGAARDLRKPRPERDDV